MPIYEVCFLFSSEVLREVTKNQKPRGFCYMKAILRLAERSISMLLSMKFEYTTFLSCLVVKHP